MSSRAVNGLDESVSLLSLSIPAENRRLLKPMVTWGFDSALKIQALSVQWLMKAPQLCLKKHIKQRVTLMGGCVHRELCVEHMKR